MKIAALMTCHNRKAKTLNCLRNLAAQKGLNAHITVYLVADGCTDGTVDAVKNEFPDTTVLQGDGSLFWNRGMHLAFATAIGRSFDYYLWVNDDTMISDDAVSRLLSCAENLKNTGIIVGSIFDPVTGALTYGGVSRPIGWKRTHFERVAPRVSDALTCETMNGNLVLIPSCIVVSIGNVDEKFPHSMGDYDYGLRARESGYSVWVAPGQYGTCARNPVLGTFEDRSLPFSVRWKKMTSVKGLPLDAWAHFTRRHAGTFWPLFWLWPYTRLFLSVAFRFSRS